MLILAAKKHWQLPTIRPKIINIGKDHRFGQPITIWQVMGRH
jgi:hypothetical protein